MNEATELGPLERAANDIGCWTASCTVRDPVQDIISSALPCVYYDLARLCTT